MNLNWDLEIMYKGYDDPKYINDIKKVEETITKIKELKLDENNPIKTIEASLVLTEELNTLLMELFSYSSLRSSTNVNDFEAMTEMGKLQIMLQETVESDVLFQSFLTKFNLDDLAKESNLIKTYLFLLKKQQEEATHMLSEKDLASAICSITGRIVSGGMFVASIRDYDALLASKPPYSPPYIHKTEKGQRVSFQTWDWEGDNYKLIQYIIDDQGTLQISKFACEYRATRREELTELLLQNGCTEVEWKFPEETGFYQPIVIARK